jgi:hypothetical protein
MGAPETPSAASATDGSGADGLHHTPTGITMAQPLTGALRPTLVLGVGAFGRRGLSELRCRFVDRFGDLARIPLVRFLYLDPDPDAGRMAGRGAAEVALAAGEVCPLPLQPVGNYRRRMLEQISEWLPREKLYAMPRSLQTQGARALGRLAFADNHLRLMARLKRDLQHITHPDTLFHAVRATELALRDNRPRVYVIAAAGGGGSGMLVDMGYNVRRLLHQLRHPEAEIVALLFCGAPQDPATPKAEQANVYATLTELNHYADPGIRFSAQYGSDGPRTVESGAPFHHAYLIQVTHRSPEALRDAVAHLGSYLFHELTTPLGLRLDRCRRAAAATGQTQFRSFGTYAVWFPRGLLLRLAARRACARLLAEWQAAGPTGTAEVEAACASASADPALAYAAVCQRLRSDVDASFDGNLAGALTGFLAGLEQQSVQPAAQEDPGNWARQALQRVDAFVGAAPSLDTDPGWQRSRVSRALQAAVQQVAVEWGERFGAAANGLMEQPGARVAAAEAGLNRLIRFCDDAAAAHQPQVESHFRRTQELCDQVRQSLDNCAQGAGGFSLFGGRSRRMLRALMDHLAAFSRQRLVEDVAAAGLHFYAALKGLLQERLRELAFCRQRLRHLQELLQSTSDQGADLLETGATPADVTPAHSPPPSPEAYWESIRNSSTARVLLPDGDTDMERAAEAFVAKLKPEQWDRLDEAMQEGLLAELGGLHHLCTAGGDLPRHLTGPMIGVAAECLGQFLPETDVAEVGFAGRAAPEDRSAELRACHAQAAPLLAGSDGAAQPDFLLTPASEAGKNLAEQARQAVPGLEVVLVPGQADLMFCREQGSLRPEEIRRVFQGCRQAYEERVLSPTSSPHARFDFNDWVPLDP